MHEPGPKIKLFNQGLLQALSEDRCASDAEFATWLAEVSAPAITKAFMNEKSYDRNVSGTAFVFVRLLTENESC
jgi:hypothetical protein